MISKLELNPDTNLNAIIFSAFLIANLILGLWSSKGVKNIKEYAIGNRDFDTGTLVAAIVALSIGGEFFATIVTEAYKNGILFMSILIANFFSFIFIAYIFAPRLSEFLGKLSIAEAMGELYGPHVRVFTAIVGFVGVSGVIAIQLQIAGLLFEYAFGINGAYGIIIAGLIITIYSALGGIKAVTFTDVIQFLTFSIVIPSIGIMLYAKFGNESVIKVLSTNPKFSFKESFSLDNPDIYCFASLFIWLLVPGFMPGFFQRISMAKDIEQVKNSFTVAAFAEFFLAGAVCWISMLLWSKYPNLEGDQILKFLIVDYQWVNGFAGLIVAGIMAMIMSTADSLINSNAVLIIHDLKEPLRLKFIKNELFSTRVCALIIGIIAILFALRGGNFFELIVWTSTMYMPVVTIPFIMTLFGFRSSGKTVLASMIAGITTVILWSYFDIAKIAYNVGALVPAMLANLATLFAFHYIFKQKGGWVGIKDPSILTKLKEEKKRKREEFWNSVRNFDFVEFLKKNTPKDDGGVAILGVVIVMLIFISAASLPTELRSQYKELIEVSYISTLFFTATLVSYPVWAPNWKGKTFIAVCWNITIFYVLSCFGFLMVLLSSFGDMQVIIYMVCILIIICIIDWRWALTMLISGMIIVTSLYKSYVEPEVIIRDIAFEFKVLYLIFLVVGIVITFFKPKQQYMKKTEEEVFFLNHENESLGSKLLDLSKDVKNQKRKIDNLISSAKTNNQKLSEQEKEIARLNATSDDMLSSFNRKMRNSVFNIQSCAEFLNAPNIEYNKDQINMLYADLKKNATNLAIMTQDMICTAELKTRRVKLNKLNVFMDELVENSVEYCSSNFIGNKPITIEKDITTNISVPLDSSYVRLLIHNLIINAINFTNEGTIKVAFWRYMHIAFLTVTDPGIGIPKGEEKDIFLPFKTGSNVASKENSGRGLGLALCKAVVDAHRGDISAKTENGETIFTVALPVFRDPRDSERYKDDGDDE